MKSNMKVVRLTESKLKQMIVEAVQETLNEYGETPQGQFMLGRLAHREERKGNENPDSCDAKLRKRQALQKSKEIEDYAAKKRGKDAYHIDNLMASAFRSGVANQWQLQNAIDSGNDDAIKRKKDMVSHRFFDFA